jgi:sulfur-oxidizing protein SoxX
MRTSFITLAITMCVMTPLGAPGVVPLAQAAGQAPDSKACNNRENPPKDTVTQGGCIAIARIKGNCQACHNVAGVASGNIAPSLAGVAQRIQDKSRLRAQIQDPTKFNPKTIMPLYGKHEILTPDEIDKVIEWLWTL